MLTKNRVSQYLLLGALCGLSAGCNESQQPATSAPPTTVTANRVESPDERTTTPDPVDRNNTGVNARDVDGIDKTPIDQNENQTDINVTAEIRKQVVDTKMSVDAQNVKIITQDGIVTLRGPVATVRCCRFDGQSNSLDWCSQPGDLDASEERQEVGDSSGEGGWLEAPSREANAAGVHGRIPA